MRSRITVSILSLSVAVLSLALGGCTGGNINNESNFSSGVSQPAENSSGGSAPVDDSSDNSTADSTPSAPAVPSGTPTIFIGPDGNPIYDSEVTKLISYKDDFSKKAAEITADDEYLTILCEGFQYFKEPGGVTYNSFDDPEMFDGLEFKGEMPENKNPWKRVNVGDEICGLKLKYAVSQFVMENKEANDFEKRGTYYNCEQPDVYQFSKNGELVEFEGSITLTGFLSSCAPNYYFPDGGFMDFTPVEDKLPVMCYDEFITQPDTYRLAALGGSGLCSIYENNISIRIKDPQGEIKNQQEIEFADEELGIGDTVLARVTLSNITYGYGHYAADFSDVEILSDVLAHEGDQI